jgi:hypothetical protein
VKLYIANRNFYLGTKIGRKHWPMSVPYVKFGQPVLEYDSTGGWPAPPLNPYRREKIVVNGVELDVKLDTAAVPWLTFMGSIAEDQYKLSVIDFTYMNFSNNLTNEPFNTGGNDIEPVMPWAGCLLGLTLDTDGDVTQGSVVVRPTINTVPISVNTLDVTLDSAHPVRGLKVAEINAIPFNVGDTLGLVGTSTSDFLPIDGNLSATLFILVNL